MGQNYKKKKNQWYDIIYFESISSHDFLCASAEGLIQMELVFLTYKYMIIP